MFNLSGKAYEDLKSIAIYTEEKWGKNQRTIYLKMMDDAFHELSDNPDLGRKIDDIRTGYYKYKAGKHLIFYRLVSQSDIEIVRILHQKMDIESRLQDTTSSSPLDNPPLNMKK